jgi:hypothetical protein
MKELETPAPEVVDQIKALLEQFENGLVLDRIARFDDDPEECAIEPLVCDRVCGALDSKPVFHTPGSV